VGNDVLLWYTLVNALTIIVIIEVTGNDNKQPIERALRKIEWTTEGFLVEILKRTR
jgi:hypothetical protein